MKTHHNYVFHSDFMIYFLFTMLFKLVISSVSKSANALCQPSVRIGTPSFLKFLAIQDHAENLEEQLWMQGREGVSVISHRSVTSSDFINK